MDVQPGVLTQPALSKEAYLGTTVTFLALAIICTILRTVVRIAKWRRLYADDYFLLLAFLTLIGGSILTYLAVPSLYYFADVISGRAPITLELLQDGAKIALYASTAEVLNWTTIFSIKFSFLFYFKRLVRRLRKLTILWWFTFAVLVPVSAVSISTTFIVCPYAGSGQLLHCVTGQNFFNRENAVLYYSVVSDIATDALLVCIPVCLLWQTKFPARQKISIGIVLCLSIIMIAIALVRGISARVYGTTDQTWSQFWVQLESCISVIMVCMTALRTLFVTETSSDRPRNVPRSDRRLPRSGRRFLLGRRLPAQLPDIETGATITGMRTMIRHNGRTIPGSFGTSASVTSQGGEIYHSNEATSVRQGF